MTKRAATRFFYVLLGLLSAIVQLPAGLGAVEVKIFRADSRDAVLKGTLDSLSLGPLGSLELARRVERLAKPEEPFVFTAAAHPRGWVLGTGNSGKVLLVEKGGEIQELYAASEPEVFAVLSAEDGTVYAGTSPYGKVYRIPPEGEPSALFESGDAYIWALALDPDGRLLVATGLGGRLYRINPDRKADEQTAEILYESADSHVRALAALSDGRVLLGTAGQGLVLELIDGPGQGRKSEKTVAVATLYDAVQPEILSFTTDGEGTAYAAVLASEASLVDLSQTQPPPKSTESESEGTVSVVSTQDTVGSRGAGFSGPRSLVLRIRPGGEVEELLQFQDENVHSVLWHQGALWIGTGEEGHLYRYEDEELILERDLEERQITALVPSGQEAAAVTTNSSAVYRIPGGAVGEGTYTSSVLDAGQVARFGSFLWQGELPAGGRFELAARSGMSSQPDATWTAWKGVGDGREISLGDLPRGRYVQWRATLKGDRGKSPRVLSSELSYRQQNLKPQVKSFEVLAPGEILVPSNFTAQNQTFEPWSPNREGIFTSLRPEKSKDNSRLKTLWKKGYRSLRWEVSDANEDELVYALAFRRENEEAGWLTVVEELEDSHFSFDVTVLPDGVYRFRLTASDAPGQGDSEALEVRKVSEPITVDHTPPLLARSKRNGDGVYEVELRDPLNPIRDVVYSVDASEWKNARPADGLLDGRREVVKLEVPETSRMLLLRVSDAAFNVVTFDLMKAASP